MKKTLSLFFAFTLVIFSAITTVPAQDDQIPTVDGVILEDEYPRQIQEPSTNIEVYWYNDEVYLWIGLRSPGLGWIAIGFEPEAPLHQGANLIVGYVEKEQLFIQDEYGVGPMSHESDETLGGTHNILESAGIESEGKTTVEFKIPLDSGDVFDKTLEPNNNYTTILAYHATADDLISPHTARATTVIETIPEFPSFLILPLFMIATLLALIAYRRKQFQMKRNNYSDLMK